MSFDFFDEVYKKQELKYQDLLIKLKRFQIKTNGNKLNNTIAEEQNNIKRKFFENCSSIFNEINNVNQDTKHWKLIINSWLNFFIVSYLYKFYFFKSLGNQENRKRKLTNGC